MGGYNTSIGGGQVLTTQQPSHQNWNEQPSYSGYSVSGSDTVSGGQGYGSQVMGGAGNYGGVGLMQQSMIRKPDQWYQ